MRLGLLSPGGDPGAAAPAERHRAIVERAVLAEALGFDAVWLGGPAAGDPVLAAPAVGLAAIAARTARVRLGASLGALADRDPLRVAEDYATVDAIAAGRVEIAAGCALPFARDGADPASGESGERLREGIDLVRRLWSERDVTWSGRFRGPLERVTVEPRPAQAPHPPIWLAGASPEAIELAVALGLPLLLPCAAAGALAAQAARYRAGWSAAGRAPAEARIGCCQLVELAPAAQAAREGSRRRGEPAPEDLAIRGTPAAVADRLAATRDALGLDLILACLAPAGAPPADALELFAAHVLPHLRR